MGYQNYILDSAIPKQHIQFNGIVDMPFGRGKRFLGGSNRIMDDLVGGWQVAGDGNILSQDFQPAKGNWGPTNPLRIYKHKAKITDCRSGVCHQAFEWFNGYLFPTVTTDCTSNCVTGLPSGWTPYESPVDTTPPTSKYCETKDVQAALSNGTATAVAYSPGPQAANSYSHTLLNGPMNWTIGLRRHTALCLRLLVQECLGREFDRAF